MSTRSLLIALIVSVAPANGNELAKTSPLKIVRNIPVAQEQSKPSIKRHHVIGPCFPMKKSDESLSANFLSVKAPDNAIEKLYYEKGKFFKDVWDANSVTTVIPKCTGFKGKRVSHTNGPFGTDGKR